MQSDRQHDHAEARTEMPPGDRDGIDRLRAQHDCELRKLIYRKPAQVVRRLDTIE
jgi:hypothetical protein